MSKQSIVAGLLVCSLFGALAQSSVATPDNQSGTPSAPATAKLGQGETQIAQSLAKAELNKLGITQPTSAQMAAALNGGTVTSPTGVRTQLRGVLSERSAGLGWGEIAHEMGFRLGDVVSASKTEHAGKKDSDSDAHESNARAHSTDASHAGAAGNGGGSGNSGGSHGGGKK